MSTNWKGTASVPRWYSVLFAVFIGGRAVSTLWGSPGWGVPGTGWRALEQLVVVAILVVGIARPKATNVAVGAVSVIYVLSTLSELADSGTLLAVIPVDMRDRYLHPLFGLLGFGALVIARRRAKSIPTTPTAAPAP